MGILVDLGVNLIAGLIGLLSGLLLQTVRRRFQSRRARSFWAPFVATDLIIVIGRFSQLDEFEQTGYISFGEAMALAELQSHFDYLGFRNFRVTFDDRLTGPDLRNNLILLGGPDANKITQEILSHLTLSLSFGDVARNEIAIRDFMTGKSYAPLKKSVKSDELALDYGVIFKGQNPFDLSKNILIIAGSFGYGTWAGARYLKSSEFLLNSFTSNGEYLECLIETDIALKTPQTIRLLVSRRTRQKGGS